MLCHQDKQFDLQASPCTIKAWWAQWANIELGRTPSQGFSFLAEIYSGEDECSRGRLSTAAGLRQQGTWMNMRQAEQHHITCLIRTGQPRLAHLLTSRKVDTLKYPLARARAGSHPEPLPSSTGQGSYICCHYQVLHPIAAATSEEINSCSRVHNSTHVLAFLKAGEQPRARHKEAKTMSWQWPNTGNSQQTWQKSRVSCKAASSPH